MTTEIEQIDWGHWILRLVAFIIDGIILGIVAGIVSAFLVLLSLFAGFYNGLGFLVFSFIWGVLSFLYFMILDTYWGATIGKRLLGLQVQTMNGGKIPFDKSFIRNISKIFWPFLILDWLVGILTPGDKHQKLSDRYAGTTIIKTTIEFPPPPPPPPPS